MYAVNLDDDSLLEVAKTEGRVLLTRDVELHGLAHRKQIAVCLVKGNNTKERLISLSRKIGMKLELDPDTSRCSKCNSKIRPVRKEDIIKDIPSGTASFYERFWRCSKCYKIYWQGAHWKNISKTLEKALSQTESQ
jgi:uncharacterized protein with PIN domain